MKIKRIFALLFVFTMVSAGPIFAVNTPETVVTTATINVGKTLTPSNGVYPDVDSFIFDLEPFSYTLASTGNTVADADADYMPVGGEVTVNVTEDAANNRKQGITEKNLDFSGKEPGVYTYTLQERVPDVPVTGVDYDPTLYYVNVYVINQVDENNVPTGNVTISRITAWKNENMSEDALKANVIDGVADPDAENGKVGVSTDENPAELSYPFLNTYETSAEIHLTKTVAGNYANKEQEFTFEIDLNDGLGEAGTYDIVYYDVDGNEITNKAETITSDIKHTISLKHGEKIYIKNLPASASYVITEIQERTYSGEYTIDGGIVDDIKTAEAATGINLAASGKLADNKMSNGVLSNEEITFVNTKNYIVPTGIILSVSPFVVGVALVIGMFILVNKNKIKEEE